MNPAGNEKYASATVALLPRTPVGCESFRTHPRLMSEIPEYGGSVMRKHQLVLAVALAWGNAAPMAGGGFVPR